MMKPACYWLLAHWSAWLLLAASTALAAPDPVTEAAKGLRGFAVHLGAGDGQRTVALAQAGEAVIHVLAPEATAAAAAVRAANLDGRVAVESWTSPRLPYSDRVADLVVAEKDCGFDEAEIKRILVPGGTALIADGTGWRTLTGAPATGADEWTHQRRGAEANPVSRDSMARARRTRGCKARPGPVTGVGPREQEFLAAADSFYLASVSESGWPYVQHRGGPRGFLKVVAPSRLAFADFRGNRQFVSAGNVSRDDRVSLIVMDYPNRRRLKLLGHLRFMDATTASPALPAAVALAGYQGRVERVAVIDIEAFDWNCRQHITPRFTREDFEQAAAPLRSRIADLEAELATLRGARPRWSPRWPRSCR